MQSSPQTILDSINNNAYCGMNIKALNLGPIYNDDKGEYFYANIDCKNSSNFTKQDIVIQGCTHERNFDQYAFWIEHNKSSPNKLTVRMFCDYCVHCSIEGQMAKHKSQLNLGRLPNGFSIWAIEIDMVSTTTSEPKPEPQQTSEPTRAPKKSTTGKKKKLKDEDSETSDSEPKVKKPAKKKAKTTVES